MKGLSGEKEKGIESGINRKVCTYIHRALALFIFFEFN